MLCRPGRQFCHAGRCAQHLRPRSFYNNSMPELPDVEATCRYLRSERVVGRTLTGARIDWSPAIRGISVEEFVLGITGRRIRDVARRAKNILVRLDGSGPTATLAIHLRMTGALVIDAQSKPAPRHTRNALLLDDKRAIHFIDPRKLGTLMLLDDESKITGRLGPEPLNASFTPKVLGERLGKRRVPVKALLCEQDLVAGIGNIFADEALWLARIHPLRQPADLSKRDLVRLHQAIHESLTDALERIMPKMPVFSPPSESPEGLEELLVPRQAGQPCRRCGAKIKRLIIRGRSAYFCPKCQR